MPGQDGAMKKKAALIYFQANFELEFEEKNTELKDVSTQNYNIMHIQKNLTSRCARKKFVHE